MPSPRRRRPNPGQRHHGDRRGGQGGPRAGEQAEQLLEPRVVADQYRGGAVVGDLPDHREQLGLGRGVDPFVDADLRGEVECPATSSQVSGPACRRHDSEVDAVEVRAQPPSGLRRLRRPRAASGRSTSATSCVQSDFSCRSSTSVRRFASDRSIPRVCPTPYGSGRADGRHPCEHAAMSVLRIAVAQPVMTTDAAANGTECAG